MVSLLVGRTLMRAVRGLVRPVEAIRTGTDILVGIKKKTDKRPIRLDLFVTREQFMRIVKDKDVNQGLQEAAFLQKTGDLPTCPACGGIGNSAAC